MPKWTYLLVYNDACGTYEQVKRFIDSQESILNWHRVLPHSFILVSDKTATHLTEIFKQLTNGKNAARFLILDTNTDRNGWLPRRSWELMKKPRAWNEPP